MLLTLFLQYVLVVHLSKQQNLQKHEYNIKALTLIRKILCYRVLTSTICKTPGPTCMQSTELMKLSGLHLDSIDIVGVVMLVSNVD